jgi:hypothetical protein
VTEADDNAEEEQEEAEAAEAEAEGVWARGRMFADAPPACAAAAAAAASRGTMADSSFAVAVVAARVEGLGRWVVVRRTCPRPLIAAAEDDDDDDEDDEDAADSAEVFRVGCSWAVNTVLSDNDMGCCRMALLERLATDANEPVVVLSEAAGVRWGRVGLLVQTGDQVDEKSGEKKEEKTGL